VNPWLFLAGAVLLTGALAASLITIACTVIPALPKITAALQGRGGLGE
jgi:hypothetical protein